MTTKFELFTSKVISALITMFNRGNYKYRQGNTTDEQTIFVRNIIKNDLVVRTNDAGYFCILTDGSELWIRNYPYQFAFQYKFYAFQERPALPDVYTRILFKKYLMKKFNLPDSYFG